MRCWRADTVIDVPPGHTKAVDAGSDLARAEIPHDNARRTGWIIRVVALVLGAGLVIDQLRVVLSFERSHTNEDQTILWYAGRELLSGRVHEPNFFGQRYGTTFEAFPGALLHTTGLPWGTAIPLGTALLVTLAWVVVAVGAYRRGQPIAALLALAAPLFMRLPYLLLFDSPRGVLAGDFAAALAVAIALGARRHETRLCSLVVIGGLAILWDYAAALAVVPVLVYVVCTDWPHYRQRIGQTGLLLAVAALPPLAWLLFTASWWDTHRFYLTYPSPSTQPHWSILVHNLHHLSEYVSFFAPALAPVAGVAVVIVAVGTVLVIVLAIRRRSLPLLLATGSLLVAVCLAISLNRATEVEPGLYLAGSRLLLPLPFAVWFLAFGALDTAQTDLSPDSPQTKRYVAVIAAVSAISLVATQITFSSVSARSTKSTVGVTVTTPMLLSAECAALTRVYRSTGAQLLATSNVNEAYGCAAEYGLNTLIPYFDRRGWIIRTSLHQPVRRILVAVPNCGYVESMAGHCTSESAGVVLVQTPAVPAARALDHINGMHVMFGMFIFY
jgi:hypothetical protein